MFLNITFSGKKRIINTDHIIGITDNGAGYSVNMSDNNLEFKISKSDFDELYTLLGVTNFPKSYVEKLNERIEDK